MKDPIFICGHRKSGTTMFHNLFDGHEELLVYPSDLNLLYAYFPIYISEKYSDEERLERLDTVLFKEFQQVTGYIRWSMFLYFSSIKFRDCL